MIRFEKRRETPKHAGLRAAIVAGVIAFTTGCVIFGCLGVNPFTGYGVMFKGVFGSFHSFSEVLVKATPLTFTGLAVAVAAVMMLWNIGAEGQLVWGGIFAAGTSLYLFPGAPGVVLIPMVIAAADAAGVNVGATRTAAIVIGGLFSGLAGSYLSLSYTPGWKETMTGGQGWIAIAMVIFCTWNPLRAFWGALLFGSLTALQFFFQATSMDIIPSYLLKMMPYLLTIAVLTLVTSSSKLRRSSSPNDLGIPFIRER